MNGNWITVASFSQPVEAHLARTRLESEGITCVVSDEYLVRIDWFLSNAVGGVKLLVPAWEAARARDLLRPRPRLLVVGNADAPADGEMICPRCHCDDVYYTRYSRRVAGVFILLLGFMIPWRDRRWTCKQCGYAWKER
jgi:hypothetical protein